MQLDATVELCQREELNSELSSSLSSYVNRIPKRRSNGSSATMRLDYPEMNIDALSPYGSMMYCTPGQAGGTSTLWLYDVLHAWTSWRNIDTLSPYGSMMYCTPGQAGGTSTL
jgi:hypothetical protein